MPGQGLALMLLGCDQGEYGEAVLVSRPNMVAYICFSGRWPKNTRENQVFFSDHMLNNVGIVYEIDI